MSNLFPLLVGSNTFPTQKSMERGFTQVVPNQELPQGPRRATMYEKMVNSFLMLKTKIASMQSESPFFEANPELRSILKLLPKQRNKSSVALLISKPSSKENAQGI